MMHNIVDRNVASLTQIDRQIKLQFTDKRSRRHLCGIDLNEVGCSLDWVGLVWGICD